MQHLAILAILATCPEAPDLEAIVHRVGEDLAVATAKLAPASLKRASDWGRCATLIDQVQRRLVQARLESLRLAGRAEGLASLGDGPAAAAREALKLSRLAEGRLEAALAALKRRSADLERDFAAGVLGLAAPKAPRLDDDLLRQVEGALGDRPAAP